MLLRRHSFYTYIFNAAHSPAYLGPCGFVVFRYDVHKIRSMPLSDVLPVNPEMGAEFKARFGDKAVASQILICIKPSFYVGLYLFCVLYETF